MVLQKSREFTRQPESHVVFNYNDIAAEAESLMQAARDEAQTLIAQAHQQAEVIHQDARRQGHAQGLAEGKTEGQKQGCEQALQEARQEFETKSQEAMNNLQSVLQEFDQAKHAILWRAEQDTVALAVAIAKKVIKKASLISNDVTAENIKSALSFVAKTTDVTVQVHPHDATCLKELLDRDGDVYGQYQSIHVDEIESIERGGCVVMTPGGQIDARLEVQIERLAEELLMAG